MKTLECNRCHRLFKSTDERIYIHTKTEDQNLCSECTKRALKLLDQKLKQEESVKLNYECMSCPMKVGCLTLCATKPEDVIKPPCGKYAIGITANDNETFWTRPVGTWIMDRFNTNPEDLRFVVVDQSSKEETGVSII